MFLLISWLASASNVGKEPSMANQPTEALVEHAEFIFIGKVVHADVMASYGPLDSEIGYYFEVAIDEQVKGTIDSGKVKVFTAAYWSIRPPIGGDVVVLGHSKRFYCHEGPCSRAPMMAELPIYDDIIILERRGSAVLNLQDEAWPEVYFLGSGPPPWANGLAWGEVVAHIRGVHDVVGGDGGHIAGGL